MEKIFGGKKKQEPEFVYAVPVSEKKPGETEIYRNFLSKDKLPEYNACDPECTIVREVYEKSFLSHLNKDFIFTRSKVDNKFHPITYKEGLDHIKHIGSGIIQLNLAPERQEYKDYR